MEKVESEKGNRSEAYAGAQPGARPPLSGLGLWMAADTGKGTCPALSPIPQVPRELMHALPLGPPVCPHPWSHTQTQQGSHAYG